MQKYKQYSTWRLDGGRNPRQPGQIWKEAAVTNFLRVAVQSLHFSLHIS